jgi:pterin-4a-carbinolamine dehydratase
LAFVSYRRDDTAPFALALKSELEKRLANTLVFVDMLRINPADVWPDVLTDSLERARCVLVLIGERWLEPQDGGARPRLFDEKDWVRTEIEIAFGKADITVLPVLVGKANSPESGQLPESIRRLVDIQAVRLSPENWHRDVATLSATLVDVVGLDHSQAQIRWPKPNPIKRLAPAATQEILQELRAEGILKNWRVELEHDYAGDGTFAEQLVLRVRFKTFKEAIRFMSDFAFECDQQNHHPIWENVFRNLTIKLRTFDAGHRVSFHDLEMADKINKALQDYQVSVLA